MLCLACGRTCRDEMDLQKHHSSHLHIKGVEPAHYRICIFGDGGVGKSAMTQVFVNKRFPHEYDPTIEDSYHTMLRVDGDPVALDILDTAGQEEFSPMRAQYMQSAAGFILAFAMDSRASFLHLHALRAQLLKHNPGATCMLVATKADLHHRREVSEHEAQQLARRWRCEYVEVSARTGTNLGACFTALVLAMRRAAARRVRRSVSSRVALRVQQLAARVLALV